jgi:SHS2 domain-containing protein
MLFDIHTLHTDPVLIQHAQAMAEIAKPHWEHFPHEADMGVRGYGASREQAFEQAALALTSVITDLAKVVAREPIDILCEAPDDELLFVDWLNSLVYEMATRHMLFSRFTVHLDGSRLAATAWGEPLDIARHQPAVEVKGATYTGLRVAQTTDGQWVAECIVDV